jgi:phosphoribosylformimino-5-aminoimidazole carboxamide ribotide isomerase
MSIQIIPAIDIIGGKCVRLHKGRFHELTTYDVPVKEMLGLIVDAGFQRVHIVDLDGAKAGEPLQLELIAGLSQQFDIQVQTGGGYRNLSHVKRALGMGIDSVIIGSAAVRNHTFFRNCLEQFESESIILAADVCDNQVRVSAWEEEGGISLVSLLDSFIPYGLMTVIITDIQRDGTLNGPALELYKDVHDKYPKLQIIASGGIGNKNHIALLADAGIRSVVIGKALYEGILSLGHLSEINKVYAG